MFISFARLGKFSVIISSNSFSVLCFFSLPSGVPMMRCYASRCSRGRLNCPHLKKNFFFAILFGCSLLCCVLNHWFKLSASSHLLLILLLYYLFLTGSFLLFLSLCVSSQSSSGLPPEFVEHPSNQVFWTLYWVDCLSSYFFSYFPGVLSCSFTWDISWFPHFGCLPVYFYVLGRFGLSPVFAGLPYVVGAVWGPVAQSARSPEPCVQECPLCGLCVLSCCSWALIAVGMSINGWGSPSGWMLMTIAGADPTEQDSFWWSSGLCLDTLCVRPSWS